LPVELDDECCIDVSVSKCNTESVFDKCDDIVKDMSSLCYMNVSVKSNDEDVCRTLSALCDSGSQMTLVRSELLNSCDYQPVGKVQLRPFYGDSITADVVRVNLSCDDDGVGFYEHCAIVSGLHDEMILAKNTISRLLHNRTRQIDGRTDHGHSCAY